MDALHRFRELAHAFRRAARDGDAARMDAVLAERRALLGRFDAGADNTDPERTRALREILDLDRDSESILVRLRTELHAELAAIERGARTGPAAPSGLTNRAECRNLADDRRPDGQGGEGVQR